MKKQLFSFLLLLLFATGISAQSREARNFDEFGNLSCDDLTSRIEVFFRELKNHENLKGYVFIYEGNMLMPLYNQDGKTIKPRRNEAKAFIETIKSRIKFWNFDSERITFVEGGFRENFSFELWLVPNGTAAPKPTPTLKKMKYRKGKAEDICKYL